MIYEGSKNLCVYTKLIIAKNLWFMMKLFMIKEIPIVVRLLNNNEALSTWVFLRDFIL